MTQSRNQFNKFSFNQLVGYLVELKYALVCFGSTKVLSTDQTHVSSKKSGLIFAKSYAQRAIAECSDYSNPKPGSTKVENQKLVISI